MTRYAAAKAAGFTTTIGYNKKGFWKAITEFERGSAPAAVEVAPSEPTVKPAPKKKATKKRGGRTAEQKAKHAAAERARRAAKRSTKGGR